MVPFAALRVTKTRLKPPRTTPSRPGRQAGSSAELVQSHHGVVPQLEIEPGQLGRVWSSLGSSSSRYSATSGWSGPSWRSRCSCPARLSARSSRRHHFRREDAPAAGAGRAVGRHRVPERRPHRCRVISTRPSSRRPAPWSGPGRGPDGPQLLEHLVPVGPGLHVDEVADDDSADVAQADLPGDLPRRLQVGAEDRLLDPFSRCSGRC